MRLDITSNGIRYSWELAGPNGASFVVYKDNHTDAEIKKGIKELRNERDVVSLRRASPEEVVDQFTYDVRAIAISNGLTPYQIKYDVKDLMIAMSLKCTPKEYVEKHFKKWSKNVSFNI